MRIVITGASGNVGTALLDRLGDQTDHELIGVVRRPPAPTGVYRRVQWHRLDLADPDATAQLRPLVVGADAVVHLAWCFQPTRDLAYKHRQAVGGTAAVLAAAHDASVGQLLHMSSAGTYAPGRYCTRVDETWSTAGIPSAPYSRDKASAEALLDDYEHAHAGRGVPITRMRPGAVVQRAAAGALARYALPGYVPMRLVRWLPVLPLDRAMCIPLIHSEDVADACVRALERRARGPFNLAADLPVTRDTVADVLHARPIHVPAGILGGLADLSWRMRLQPVDRGWLDMMFAVPLLDCSRAKTELGWQPRWTSRAAVADVVAGFAERAHGHSPPLRRRSLPDQLRRDLTAGPVTTRRLP